MVRHVGLPGAGLVGWIGVTNPAWEAGVAFPLAVAGGAYVVIAFLLVHFVVELAAEGLMGNRAMRYLVAGTLTNLAVGGLLIGGMLVAYGEVEPTSAGTRGYVERPIQRWARDPGM